MADKKIYMPFDFSSFFVDTISLNDKEKVMYLEMLCFQFEHELGFKDAANVCQLLKKTRHNERQINDILKTFFEQMDGNWWQKRVLYELEKRDSKLGRLSDNGKKGGRPKKKQLLSESEKQNESIKENERELKNKETNKESESVFSDVQSSEQKPIRENPDFYIEHGEAMREFWEAYPKATKRRLMESAFLQAVVSGKATSEQLVSRAKAVRAKMTKDVQSFSFAPDPHRWLENEQWADGTLDAFEHSEKVEATTLKFHYQRVLASPCVYDPSNGNRYDTAGAEHFQRFKNGDDLIRFPNGLEIYASHLQPD